MRIQKLILALLFATCTTLFAQEEKTDVKAKSYFGLKAGFNAIKLSEHEDKSLSFGFQFGGTYTIPMSERFSFQPEVLLQTTNYSAKSSEFFFQGSRVKERSTESVLLLFPLNFKYSISKKVDVDLGPTIGYIVSRDRTETITEDVDGFVQVFNFDPDSDPYAKGTKLALAVNLGTNYNFTEKVYLGFRYSLFIGSYQNIDSTIDNSLFAFSLGYNFK